MDIATLLGLVMGMGVVVAAILVGSDLLIFLNLPGFLIVVAGTLSATLIKFPLSKVFIAFKVGAAAAFVTDKEDALSLVEFSIELATKSRKGGLLALEGVEIENDYYKKGVQLCVDGMSPEVVRKTLTSEMHQTLRRHEEGSKIFRGIGDTAPAFGMIGTLVGLVQMLANLDDPSTIGPAMAVAMLTTLYGAIIANLIALPIAEKLESRIADEESVMSLITEAVLEIQAQTNPNVLGEMLASYLPDHQRHLIGEGAESLTTDFLVALNNLATVIEKSEGDIIIAGHTDDRPIKTERFRSNWDLSAARANSVVHHLLEFTNVQSSRLAAMGYADSRPLAPNDSEENRALNRRVEVIIRKKATLNATSLDEITAPQEPEGEAPAMEVPQEIPTTETPEIELQPQAAPEKDFPEIEIAPSNL